jgi:GNAT superfamily N-acetyltransferase
MIMNSVTITRLSPIKGVDRRRWQAIRELCCQTGANGQPIAAERWELFAKIWIDPYEKLLRQWSYVAASEGAVIGYLSGCPNSKKFARSRFVYCALPLLLDIAVGRYRRSPDAHRFARRALGLASNAEDGFAADLRSQIARQYPAHLHVNVGAEYRGRGVGRRLIESFFADLRAVGVAGVHVLCGPEPVPFYKSTGFHELASRAWRGGRVHALGCRL